LGKEEVIRASLHRKGGFFHKDVKPGRQVTLVGRSVEIDADPGSWISADKPVPPALSSDEYML